MTDVFLKLLNMSFTASCMIVAIIIFRLAARRIPKWIMCMVWGLVAIRLICPFSIESSLSVVPSDEIIPKSIISESYYNLDNATDVGPIENKYVNTGIGISKLGSIWAGGVIGLLLYAVIRNLFLRVRLKESVMYRDNIFFCDFVCSPFIYGFFRPHIYLPSGIDESDIENVVVHEKAHLQRKDHIWRVMAFLILGIYWFNPLIWLAFSLFSQDIELACDEKVIKNLGAAERKAYINSLMSCSFRKRKTVVFSLAFGEVGVKKRVKSILDYKKPTFAVIILSALAFILIGVCFLTIPPKESQNGLITSTELSQSERQRLKKTIDLQEKLQEYDKDNILYVAVYLQELDTADSYAEIFIINKEAIMDTEEQNEIKKLAAEYLQLDFSQIYLECVEKDTFLLQ